MDDLLGSDGGSTRVDVYRDAARPYAHESVTKFHWGPAGTTAGRVHMRAHSDEAALSRRQPPSICETHTPMSRTDAQADDSTCPNRGNILVR